MPVEQVEEDPLVDALSQTAFLVLGVLTRVGAAYELSVTQMRVLGVLRNRRLRMSDLADHLGLDRSSTTGLVDRAERRGLVRRAPSPDDGRSVAVELTATGVELVGTVGAEVTSAMGRLTTGLPVADRRRLVALLSRLTAS